jgi:segregation and condensation protein B
MSEELEQDNEETQALERETVETPTEAADEDAILLSEEIGENGEPDDSPGESGLSEAYEAVETSEGSVGNAAGEEPETSEEQDEPDDEVDDTDGVVIHDADAEDAREEAERLAAESVEISVEGEVTDEEAPLAVRSMAEMMAIIEALIFVSDEPLSVKTIAEVLKEDKGWVQTAVEALSHEFNERNGGLYIREVAGGWQIATRPEHHEFVRAFLKSRPSAKLSLASLETLAVIAYKQPITVPEILEIRGVHSSSAIKTLLDKRLIVAKGRKETVGRPMMYGTSKEFLLQFGLKDLSELPNVEDFEDLASGNA